MGCYKLGMVLFSKGLKGQIYATIILVDLIGSIVILAGRAFATRNWLGQIWLELGTTDPTEVIGAR
jgi:hypothetical protein